MRYRISLACTTLLLARAIQADQIPRSEDTCTHPPYKIHLFSQAPLLIYISGFLSLAEREHLQEVSKHNFTRSTVTDESGVQAPSQTRTSQSTTVTRDSVIRCIESRAASFQGLHISRSHLEPLQLVQYGSGENYRLHTDWLSAPSQISSDFGGNRLSSFFAYVAASDLTGGGTNFPMLDAPNSERWCAFVDCDEPWENGVTFKPVPGNAIFWQNLNEDRSGNSALLHSGLPVTSGSKLGMNIWTREEPLDKKLRGADDFDT